MLIGRILSTRPLYNRKLARYLSTLNTPPAMKTHFTIDKVSPSLYLRIVAENLKESVSFKWDSVTALKLSNLVLHSPETISRHLARLTPDAGIYGQDALQQAEVDHWIWFGLNRFGHTDFNTSIRYCNEILSQNTYMVGSTISLADMSVFAGLLSNRSWNIVLSKGLCGGNLKRWYDNISNIEEFKVSVGDMPKQATKQAGNTGNALKEEGGKFVDLPGATQGNVVVRFPPEASGYLHIGHAKAALLNQYYQQSFNGKFIMRFDDTNPAKENAEFEDIILEDVKMLNIKYDTLTFTSNHFEVILLYAEEMIKKGLAYVDDTEPARMKEEREKRHASVNRSNSVADNLTKWEEMKRGTDYGKTCCLRAKIDMGSDNGCLRDPTMYRCKDEVHPRTGAKYKVYPTYDFACPIVDSVDGVTHALRTTEYHDRDVQYYWFIDQLGIRRPSIWDYARLNLTHTILSKRKLAWFVEQGLVSGWDDPRLPTVRGVLRRGMSVEALKQFVILQGSAKSVVQMSWDKIWTINKKIIDPVAPRYTALDKSAVVPVTVTGVTDITVKQHAKHPKNTDVGEKDIYYGPSLYLEGEDAATLALDQMVTMINWGNMAVEKIDRDIREKISGITLSPRLDNTDYKKTVKLTWLCDVPQNIPAVALHYDNIISKAVLGKDEDFKSFIGHQTVFETALLGDPSLASLQKGDVIQLQRRGYYICDSPYEPASKYTGLSMPCMLINIPDGRMQQFPKTAPAPVAAAKPATVAVSRSAAGDQILLQIAEQGNVVRTLKTQKAGKDDVKAAVTVLLDLKKNYKNITGQDPPAGGKPATAQPLPATAQPLPAPVTAQPPPAADQILTDIAVQGNVVRDLKSNKAPKDEVKSAVDKLLTLKKQYEELTGQKPPVGGNPAAAKPAAVQPVAAAVPPPTATSPDTLLQLIHVQGLLVRDLKGKKASKDDIGAAVKVLLKHKADYKALTGKDAPAGGKAPQTAMPIEQKTDVAAELEAKIKEQGDKVRVAKSGGVAKDDIQALVDELLRLKSSYKSLTGQDLPQPGRQQKKPKKKEAPKIEAGVTRLGLEAKKHEDFSNWYSQVITKSEMIEYYNVSGCYILRPWAYSIWENIQRWFDKEIKKIGVENCYFPMFVSQSALEREKDHIADFAAEVAWVTRAGSSELAEPIAIRPTSETVMYPSYADWIRSHRDLPLKLNQWCNVVRWEFKHPQPFLRTREFLWQEGHSAFATREEACEEVYTILELYYLVYKYLLAIPTIKGRKTEKEKFAGGEFTTTVEGYVSASGRAIQGATSHHLGENFSKMFNITYEDPDSASGERLYVHQNSWGLTTRTIGVVVMVHGDDKGLVLPPRVSQIQVVIVPCGISDSNKDTLIAHCTSLADKLSKQDIRVRGDYRLNYTTGWKFNHWELKGVPIRMEVGPKDMKNSQVVVVRRDTGVKSTLPLANLEDNISKLLDTIHDDMYDRAVVERDANLVVTTSWDEFCSHLDQKKLIMAPFCGDIPCEERIKKDSARVDGDVDDNAPSMGAKTLCIPFEQPADGTKEICVYPDCSAKAKYYTLFGRSY